MLTTLFSGYANLIPGSTSSLFRELSINQATIASSLNNVSVIQTGFFTPTVSANHHFKMTTDTGGYLAIDGTVLINTTSNGSHTSANIMLEAGKKYTITMNTGRGGEDNKLVYALNGGSNLSITSTQLSAPTYTPANPSYNPGSVFSTLFEAVKTPESINPSANIIATDVMSNTFIATVPGPAIGVYTANIQAAYSNNYSVTPIPYPIGGGNVLSDVRVADWGWNPFNSSADDTLSAGIPEPADKGINPFPIGQLEANIGNHSWSRQVIPIKVRGVKPNTRLTLFFNQINVTDLCCQGDTYFIDDYENLKDAYPTNGRESDPIYSDANGDAVFVFRIPRTFFRWEENYEFICVDYRSDVDQYVERIENWSTIARLTSSIFKTPLPSIISTRSHSGTQSNTTSTRTGGTSDYTVYPLCQTFYVGSDMTGQQDGIYINSIDLFFAGKSSTMPVTIDIRSVENGKPTDTILPYSTVTLSSANVYVSANASTTVATNFSFSQPVYLRAGYTYAVAVRPGNYVPDYTIWSAIVGKTDPINGIVNANWGSGSLFKPTTSVASWSPIQNQFIKFKIYRSAYNLNGTATLVNDDYEFLTYIRTSSTSFQVGEFVHQQPVALPALVSVNTSSNTLVVNATATANLATKYPNPLSEFSVNDHIVICGSFPETDPKKWKRFNYNLFGNAISLKVTSVSANGSNLTFAYANGAAITGAPWSNGAAYIFKALPGEVHYDPTSRSITGTGTRFDTHQVAGKPRDKHSIPLVVHTGNSSSSKSEVLYAQTIVNSTSMSVYSSPEQVTYSNAQAIPISAPVGRVVAVDEARNLVVLDMSTANSETNIAAASNSYASPSFFAPGRTIFGVTSGASAIIGGIHDVVVNRMYPAIEDTSVPGTGLYYNANLISSDFTSIDYPNFQTKKMNNFTNTEIVISSRSNEIFRLNGEKSLKINAYLGSNNTQLTPTIDLNGSRIITYHNLINSSPQNENTRNGTALSKYVSKTITLSDGNDAEDISVYLTAYKPVGTNLIVYAKLLAADDTDVFEDKDWSILRQINDGTLYSDSENPEDYKEYQYALPTNPVTIPFNDLITTNNSTVIVSTAANTKWQGQFTANQFVTLYSDVYGSVHQVNRIASVDSNTQITLTSSVNLANTTSAIIASMPFPYSAYRNTNNANIVRYYTPDGNSHDSFKRYAIKVVMTAQNSYLVPRIEDIRVLALSV